MANNIFQVKRTSTSGRTPNTTGSYATNSQYIAAGEFALNMADGILYSSNGSSPITIGANQVNQNVSNTLTVKAISANGGNGSSGQVLTTNGTATYWSTVTSGGVNTDAQYTWTNVQTHANTVFMNNDKQLRFKTVNTSASVYFTQQNDDNFVFYTTDASYNPRAVFSIFANSSTSDFQLGQPTSFTGTNVKISTTTSLIANGTSGSAGQYLTSNGSTVYWSSPGVASVNTSAQYSWTNTHSFSANVTFSGNGIGLTTNIAAIYLGGIADANWKIGRNTGVVTKWRYTNNSIDIITANSNLEGMSIGLVSGNSYFETGYLGTYIASNLTIGNTTSNSTINSTAFSGTSLTANNSTYLGGYTFGAPSVIGGTTANSAAFTFVNVSGQVNTATLYVATSANISSLVVNSTGAYHTGTMNAASLTVGTTFIANSTKLSLTSGGVFEIPNTSVITSFVADPIDNTNKVFAYRVYPTISYDPVALTGGDSISATVFSSSLKASTNLTSGTIYGYGNYTALSTDAASSGGYQNHDLRGLYGNMYHYHNSNLLRMVGVAGRTYNRGTGTVGAAYSFWARNSTSTGGGVITDSHGIFIDDIAAGTNNFGITSTVSSGTNKWNLYASGSAQNYFAGNVGIGNTTPAFKLRVDGTTSLAGAVSDITTLAAGNTTVTGFVNATSSVNAASHTVGTAFTANSTVVNAVSYYSGTLLVANTTVINATHLGGTAASGYQTTAGLAANVATLAANSASYTTSIIGGLTGSMPYQATASVTSFVTIGSNTFIMTSNGSAPQWSNPTSITVGTANLATYLGAAGNFGNSTGIYTSGTINAASYTVGTNFVANTTALTVNVPVTANQAQSNFSNTAVEGHIELPYGNFIYELFGINAKLNTNTGSAGFRVKANTDVELFTVLANGFIGVGNTSPAHKLRVEGALSLSDGIHANGSFGSSGDVLTSNGTSVYWTAAAGGGGVYMKGGSSTIGTLGSEGQNIFRVNANTLNNDTTIAAGENAQATGPLVVASGKTLTIQTNARVSIV